ncbi:MAG: type III-A CRISPR-associated RAMP protein Csm3 [Deltaproteobacteria bacterium]|nr:type III-A CRISPR-associated RAMP protein Csm3 [Deltaproteobacteria bacterium]
MQLMDILEIKGRIIVKTGLRIGAGDTEMRIGGVDNPIIKHPHTLEPYIPGSSLKGKVRSLLEMKSGLMGKTRGEPVAFKHLAGLDDTKKLEAKKILKLFGAGGAEGEAIADIGPTRVSFADCPLDEAWRQKALDQGLSFTEVKSENAINRIEGVARNPRQTERVPANAEFSFTVTLKKLDIDQENDLEQFLIEGLKLLTLDALGGSGSRGYGRLEFRFDDPEITARFEAMQPFAREG